MAAKTHHKSQRTETPDRIVMERRMIVAEVPVGAIGTVHPFVALLQETAEALHQQWSAAREVAVQDGYATTEQTDSTHMGQIEDSLVADWNGTRLTIEFAPIEDQ